MSSSHKLSDARAVPAAWALGTVEVISEDERSLPDMRPSRSHAPAYAEVDQALQTSRKDRIKQVQYLPMGIA